MAQNPYQYGPGYRQALVGNPAMPTQGGFGQPMVNQQVIQQAPRQQAQAPQIPQGLGYEALVQALTAQQAAQAGDRFRQGARGSFAQRDTGKAALLGGIESLLGTQQERKAQKATKEAARLQDAEEKAQADKKARAAAGMVLANGGSQEQAHATYQAVLAGLDPSFKGSDLKMSDVNALQSQIDKTIGNDFRQRTDAVRDVTKYAQGKTGFSDHALIFRYMKFLDPNSTVREGEFATVEQTGSIPETVRVMYNKAVSGDKLTDEQRAAIVDAVVGAYPQYVENFQRDLEPFKIRARNWKANWDEISVPKPFDVSKTPKAEPKEEPSAYQPGDTLPDGSKILEIIDG